MSLTPLSSLCTTLFFLLAERQLSLRVEDGQVLPPALYRTRACHALSPDPPISIVRGGNHQQALLQKINRLSLDPLLLVPVLVRVR